MIKQFLAGWNKFWFLPGSPSPICLFRIIFGLLLLVSEINTVPCDLYGRKGMLPSVALQQQPTNLNPLLWLNPNDDITKGLFIVFIVTIIMLTIGFYTRSSALISWFLLVCFRNRNPFILHTPDNILCAAGFLLIFSPAGKMYSVDIWLKNKHK